MTLPARVLGIHVMLHSEPGGHSVSAAELAAARKWIVSQLAARAEE
jgi:predicted esterase